MLMTSYSSIESAIEALRRGANDYIIKPFDNDDFLFSLSRALDERRLRRREPDPAQEPEEGLHQEHHHRRERRHASGCTG